MKNAIVKKIMMAALTGTLCLSSSVMAYAAPMGGGRPDGQMMQDKAHEGTRPELPEGATEGERPELPEGVTEGEKPELPEGVTEGERPELPEGAAEGEKQGLPEDMKKDGGRRDKADGERMELPEGAVNIMAYKDALEGVEDEDTKSSLQEYFDAVEEAIKAEKEALDGDDELSDEEISALRDAVKEAEEALAAAFEDAGIEVSDEMPELKNGDRDELPEGVAGNKPIQEEEKAASAESGTPSPADEAKPADQKAENKPADSSNGVTKKLSDIYNWFRGLFNKQG